MKGFLYFLASTAECSTIANLFGVTVSFVYSVTKEAIAKLLKIRCFPSGENSESVIQGCENQFEILMCACAIDCLHTVFSPGFCFGESQGPHWPCKNIRGAKLMVCYMNYLGHMKPEGSSVLVLISSFCSIKQRSISTSPG